MQNLTHRGRCTVSRTGSCSGWHVAATRSTSVCQTNFWRTCLGSSATRKLQAYRWSRSQHIRSVSTSASCIKRQRLYTPHEDRQICNSDMRHCHIVQDWEAHTVVTRKCTGSAHMFVSVQAIKPAHLQRGQRVLIHAGSGGVGTAAIQIAKAWGAYVVTTASGRNREFLMVCSLPAKSHLGRSPLPTAGSGLFVPCVKFYFVRLLLSVAV